MILTVNGADFSKANIGETNGYSVLVSGRGSSNTNWVDKGNDLTMSITINVNYTYESLEITVGNNPLNSGFTATHSNGTVSLVIPANLITGVVRIKVNATSTNTGSGTTPPTTDPEEPGTGGESGETGTVRTTTNSHANPKELPGSYTITENTNLIGLLPQSDDEYYLSSGWGTASNISAITFPVVPGDRITGVTLGTKTQNGSSIDGTRVTYLNNDTIVNSVAPTTIYNEYKTSGYITVPVGVNCVSIPFTTDADSSKKELRLLTI